MEPIREADVQTQPGKRLAEEPKRKKPGKAWKTAAGIVAAAVVVLFCACCMLANSRDTFFPHTTINGVEVGGLTVAEAQSRLEAEIPQRVCKIYLSGQDGVSTEGREPDAVITFAELGLFPESGYEGMAKAPFILQQGKGYLSTALTYLEALLGKDTGYNSSLYWDSQQLDRAISELSSELNIDPLDMTYQLADHFLQITTARDGRFVADNELRRTIQNVVQNSSEAEAVVELPVEIRPAETLTARQLHDRLHGEMKNASYDAAAGTIIPEQPGADFDVAAVQKALDGAAPGETLTLDAEIEEPEVTAADLKAVLFRDVLGEAKTHVSGSAGRIGNVKLSAQIINGLVLNSGETFSYNGSVGKRTADRGFKPAPAYVKGETVDEIGGGICQTSSTLYLACLMSNLEITERYAHRYVPAYIAWGMDATVSWGGPDYKFTNNTLYPVKIITKYEKGYLTVQILGTNVDGTYVKMSNEVLSKTPWETIYQEDPTMAPGSPDVVKVTPYTGYKVNSYQTIYDKDGKVIDSHFEASSNYKVRNKVILQAPAAQPGSGTAEIPAVTPDTPSDTPVPMEPTVPAEPAASPDLPVEPEIPAEP
jgi:vancomycin resistance protein YoaR